MHGTLTSDLDPIDTWFGAPFHAIGMLRPGLQQVAFARDGSYAGLDVISGKASVAATSPTLFPGPGSSTYLTGYLGGESPDPIETCRSTKAGADYSAPGLPIIAMLTQAPTTSLVATLTTPDGVALSSKNADVCVVDASTYVSTDPVYGPTGKQILTNDNAVLIVPRTRLVAGTYAVRLAQSKQADTAWSFTVDPTSAPSTATSTATAVAPLDPVLTATSISCSETNAANGTAGLSIANPPEGGGVASYAVVVAGTTYQSGPAPDGGSATVSLGHLPAGSATITVTGSDGTSARLAVLVPGCPGWTAARVRFGDASRRHRQRVTFDNSRNAGPQRFVLHVGDRESRVRVGGGERAVAVVRLSTSQPTRVKVYVGTHLVARERVRP